MPPGLEARKGNKVRLIRPARGAVIAVALVLMVAAPAFRSRRIGRPSNVSLVRV